MSQQFEGRNLEEALDNAAKGLAVERYMVSYQVVTEKRGFLGGMKRVVIDAEVNDDAGNVGPRAEVVRPPSEPLTMHSSLPSQGREERPRRQGRGGGRNRKGRGDRDRQPSERPRPARAAFEEEIPPQQEQSEQAAAAARWCEELLDLAELPFAVRTDESEESINIRLFGADDERLLARGGEVIDAIQVLANKALSGRSVEKMVELDFRDFKSKRNEELSAKALDLAERVRSEGGEQLLGAMNPIERRIVHLALRDDPDVSTESRGDGFYKRVAIVRRTLPTPAE